MADQTMAVIATMDTKEEEVRHLQALIAETGFKAVILDVSTCAAHRREVAYPQEVISRLGGVDFARLPLLRRDAMMQTMGLGAARVLQELHVRGSLAGAIGIGGNQGTAIAAIALRALPIGVPKVIVSTVASGNTRPYVGYKDITMIFSVADLLGGPNTISRTILANAVGAVAGMARWGKPLSHGSQPVVSITAFGNTNAAVTVARQRLVERGYEVIAFHASGACGSAMEELIETGYIQGVLDLTTHELIGEICGDDIYTPLRPRLEAAGKLGIPQVIVPGGLDYFCFGPEESIPPKYRGRKIHYHNPYNTNVRATAEELTRVGEAAASKLNRARGPVVVLLPLKGWSENGRAGGPLHDPEADAAFISSLEANLDSRIDLRKIEAHINDPEFAALAAEVIANLTKEV